MLKIKPWHARVVYVAVGPRLAGRAGGSFPDQGNIDAWDQPGSQNEDDKSRSPDASANEPFLVYSDIHEGGQASNYERYTLSAYIAWL